MELKSKIGSDDVGRPAAAVLRLAALESVGHSQGMEGNPVSRAWRLPLCVKGL